MRASLRRNPTAQFAISATFLIAVCMIVLRSRAFQSHPDIASWGITFDLVISLPLLYWFFLIRTGRASVLSIAPVCLIGVGLASALIPTPQKQFLRELSWYVVPLAELIVAAAVVRGVMRLRKERSRSADPYERIQAAARTLAGAGIVAEAVAAELTMLFYAFFGWRMKPLQTPGTVITFHTRSGWGTVLACIFVLIAAEGIGMHLLLSLWSPVAAWIWTALDAWAVIWLLGDYHALRLRPSYIDQDVLQIRYGMRWSVAIPRRLIASIEEIRGSEWKRRDVLKVAILEDPRILVTLREPLIAYGLGGWRKTINAIALLPDQNGALPAEGLQDPWSVSPPGAR